MGVRFWPIAGIAAGASSPLALACERSRYAGCVGAREGARPRTTPKRREVIQPARPCRSPDWCQRLRSPRKGCHVCFRTRRVVVQRSDWSPMRRSSQSVRRSNSGVSSQSTLARWAGSGPDSGRGRVRDRCRHTWC